MTAQRALPWLIVGLAVVVWLVPLQLLGFYSDDAITDIPTYREAYERISDGQVPYADFSLEYPRWPAASSGSPGPSPAPTRSGSRP